MSTRANMEVSSSMRILPDGQIRWTVWTWHGPPDVFGNKTSHVERSGFARTPNEAFLTIAGQMSEVWMQITADDPPKTVQPEPKPWECPNHYEQLIHWIDNRPVCGICDWQGDPVMP